VSAGVRSVTAARGVPIVRSAAPRASRRVVTAERAWKCRRVDGFAAADDDDDIDVLSAASVLITSPADSASAAAAPRASGAIHTKLYSPYTLSINNHILQGDAL